MSSSTRRSSQDGFSRVFNDALRSTSISTQMAALHAVIFLMDAKAADAVKQTMVPLMDYLHEVLTVNVAKVQPTHLILSYCAAIMLIEHHLLDMDGASFIESIVTAGVNIISIAITGVTPPGVVEAVVHGLDRLLPSFTLNQALRARIESVVESAVIKMPSLTRTRSSGSKRTSAMLGMLITCMYTGQDGDRAGGLIESKGALASEAMEMVSAETMGHITSLFERADSGIFEARVVQNVLPVLLADFLDPRQVMNVIIEQFTRTMTDKDAPVELIVGVVHNCFQFLQAQGQQSVVTEWAVLASSNFVQASAQRQTAVVKLACLFISVSQEPIIRALLPSVVNYLSNGCRMDYCLFWLPAMHFFLKEDLSEEAKGMFLQVFGSVAETPFTELAEICHAVVSGAWVPAEQGGTQVENTYADA